MRPIDGDALEKILDKWRKDIARDANKGTADEMAETHGMLEAISGAISELLLLPAIPAESFNHAAHRTRLGKLCKYGLKGADLYEVS